MRSIRNFAFAAVLGLSMFSIQPGVASAEDARGVFTLVHEVHWQNCILPAGDYAFSLRTYGPPTLLTLRGINGNTTDAMLLVTDIEANRSEGSSRLVLVPHDGQSFVSALELPEFDMTLRFALPGVSGTK